MFEDFVRAVNVPEQAENFMRGLAAAFMLAVLYIVYELTLAPEKHPKPTTLKPKKMKGSHMTPNRAPGGSPPVEHAAPANETSAQRAA